MIYGAYIFKFFGTLTRLLINLLLKPFHRNLCINFITLWKGSQFQDSFNSASYELITNIIGFVVLAIIIYFMRFI